MAKRKNSFKKELQAYSAYTRSPTHSVILILPVLVFYEVGLFFFNHSDVTGIRNGADMLLRSFYAVFGIYGFYAFAVSLALAIGLTFWLEYRREGKILIETSYLVGMIAEAVIYGVLLFLILQRAATIEIMIPPLLALGKAQRIVLSLGAGIYEEFVFRVLLVSGIAGIIMVVATWEKRAAYTWGVIVSAVIFSLFHYVGIYGELFQWRSFLLRAFAGVLLSTLYVLRGFGITVYTHIFYDLLIIFLFPA